MEIKMPSTLISSILLCEKALALSCGDVQFSGTPRQSSKVYCLNAGCFM